MMEIELERGELYVGDRGRYMMEVELERGELYVVGRVGGGGGTICGEVRQYVGSRVVGWMNYKCGGGRTGDICWR